MRIMYGVHLFNGFLSRLVHFEIIIYDLTTYARTSLKCASGEKREEREGENIEEKDEWKGRLRIGAGG